MTDLIERLRALSRSEHSDFTVGDDAADEIERLQAMIDNAPRAIMDKRELLSICATTEDDFPALYALQGKRVLLVEDVE